MTVIREDLDKKISDDPNREYAVLIVVKEGVLPPLLIQKGRFVMDKKIISARISGKEIQNLVNDPAIEAIEPDDEMTTM